MAKLKQLGSVQGLAGILLVAVEMHRTDLAKCELAAHDVQRITRGRTDVVSSLAQKNADKTIEEIAQRRSELDLLGEFAELVLNPGRDGAARLEALEQALAEVFPS